MLMMGKGLIFLVHLIRMALISLFLKKENAKPSIISVTGPDGNRSCFLEKSGNYQLTYSNGESKNITIASARYLTIIHLGMSLFQRKWEDPDLLNLRI